ncbi:transglutaminase domain-containing protein [Pseudoclavibacter sp. CFCC 14310]|uniref:transglutaminase-like domain-containing protein n=1 Tax=Pseudoclavibacter sp. CFCC 14310 TaxID=2615180 RepID=UPI001300CE06|nr:transglutaminase-like domain-containing protein [Pseudoclavibacter sp. CFCC 14310]KAB1647155.1 transglutaminase domain-containing protein [Pseudoclavibacter sp. CFCC 14310]
MSDVGQARAVSRAQLVATLVFTSVVLALVIIGSWPIYRKPTLFVAGAAALVAGLAVGLIIVRRRLRALPALALALATYAVVGLLAAVPSTWSALPATLGDGALEVLTAPVTGWKNLLTITIPVGDFQGMQLPLFLVVYVAALLSVLFSLRLVRFWGLALAALAVALLFPTVFGARAAAETVTVPLLSLRAPVHLICGLLGLGLLLAWPIVRQRRQRLAARVAYVSDVLGDAEGETARKSTDAAKVAVASSGRRAARLRRIALAVGMAVVAAVVAGTVSGPLLGDRDRIVGRSVVEPETQVPPLNSPLAAFRRNFTAAHLNQTLLSVSGDAPQRLRFATLGEYDGQVFRTADPEQSNSADTAFRRVPFVLDTAGATRDATVTVGDYQSVWVPLGEQLEQLHFDGGDQRSLGSRFFFSDRLQSGLQLADRAGQQGLRSGDEYTFSFAPNDEQPSSEVGPGVGSVDGVSADLMPALNEWVAQKREGGATLGEVQRLNRLLIQRSYLGHSKDDPGHDENSWLPRDYQFRSSDAGHTRARIDGLFASMLDSRYLDCSSTVSQCAATVGDQEQYATATALVARVVGFPSRVVYGAKVDDDGQVRGRDVTAWAEVLTSDGRWVAIDADPRTDNRFVENPDQNAFKRYSPTTAQQNAGQVPPPDKDPSGGDLGSDVASGSQTLAQVLAIVRLATTVLFWAALITLPLWGVLLLKLLRRRRRRTRGTADQRVVAGWDEHVDNIVDAGGSAPIRATRREIAEPLSSERRQLADLADWAAFSGVALSTEQAAEYWRLVDAERARMVAGRTRWQRWKARLSPKSLTGYVRRVRILAQVPQRFRLGLGRGKTR